MAAAKRRRIVSCSDSEYVRLLSAFATRKQSKYSDSDYIVALQTYKLQLLNESGMTDSSYIDLLQKYKSAIDVPQSRNMTITTTNSNHQVGKKEKKKAISTHKRFSGLASYVQYFSDLQVQQPPVKRIQTTLPNVYGDLVDSTMISWFSTITTPGKQTRCAVECTPFEHDEKQLQFRRVYRDPVSGACKELPKCIFGVPDDEHKHDCCCVFRLNYARSEVANYIQEPLCMYLSKDQQARFDMCGEIPDSTPICILCRRFLTHQMAMEIEEMGISVNGIYQEYSVNVDVAGGYLASECILPSPKNGLIAPIVKFDETKLQIVSYTLPDKPNVDFWIVDQKAICAHF